MNSAVYCIFSFLGSMCLTTHIGTGNTVTDLTESTSCKGSKGFKRSKVMPVNPLVNFITRNG